MATQLQRHGNNNDNKQQEDHWSTQQNNGNNNNKNTKVKCDKCFDILMIAKMNCNYAMTEGINVWINCYEINF